MSILNTYKSIDSFVKIEKAFKPQLLEVEEYLDVIIQDQPEWFKDVVNHLVKAGGKRIRPLLVCLSYAMVSKEAFNKNIIVMAAIAEFVHTATLFHDDVIDEGQERRGKPTANKMYGNHTAILSGDFILGKVFQELNNLGNPQVLTSIIETVVKLIDGEIFQLDMKKKDMVSFEDYERLIYLKTSSLFEWSMTAGGYGTGSDDETIARLMKLGNHIGKIFQIVDDILDYTGSKILGKERLQDLSQGKITLPLLFLFEYDPSYLHEWKSLLDTTDESKFDAFGSKIISIIKKENIQKKMNDYLQKEISEIRATLALFEKSKYTEYMSDLINFLVSRMS